MLMQRDSDESGSVQERYHNYILRKLQELKDDKETGKVD